MSSLSPAKKTVIALMTLAVAVAAGLLLWSALTRPLSTEPTVPTTVPTTGSAAGTTVPSASSSPTTPQPSTVQPTTALSTTATTVATTAATAGTNAGDAAYASFDNTSTGWWFNHPAELGMDSPSTIPADIAARLDRYQGIWRQDTADKVIYLTMDEGYENKNNTTRILDIAASRNIKINFFVTGDYLAYQSSSGPGGPELVRRMIADGHLVGSHTDSHPNQAELISTGGVQAMVDDMQRLETSFTNATGQQIARFLRPPQGAYSERTLKVLSDLGYRAVMWSFAYRDWITTEQPDPAAALAQVVGELHPGAVYLLHAVSDTNVSILPDFIDAAQARGYRFALLNQIP